MNRESVLRFIAFAVLALALVPFASAQFNAAIQGTITDPSGAVVAGANVTVTNQATGVSTTVQSTGDGVYRVSHLGPGSYTVLVEAPSFKKSSSKDVVVQAETPRGLNITLQPGEVSQDVTVTDTAVGVETETNNQQGTINQIEVRELPQLGRDPYNLVRLTPGVFGDAARSANGNSRNLPQQAGPGGSNSELFQTENQVQVTANGQRVSANNILLDGVSVNSLDWGGAAVITPNQESVQEITVVSGSYSAEDGRNSGAQVKTVSKSGSNSLHGSGFGKFNDKGLNAYNKFYGPTTGTLKQITCNAGTSDEFKITAAQCPERVNQKYRQFGASLGGPIIKNKMFFFFSYEGVRLSGNSTLRNVTMLSPAFQQYVIKTNPNSIAAKMFQLPGAQPRIATTIAETDCCSLDGRPLGSWYAPGIGIGQAIGNGPDGIPDWGRYDLVVPNSSNGNQFNGRLDFNQNKNQFFFSTYNTSLDNVAGGNRPLEDVTLTPNNSIYTLGWTRTISATLLNDLRGNFTRWYFNQLNPTGNTNYGIPQIRIFDFDANGFGDPGRVFGIGRSGTTPGNLAQNTFSIRDTLSWVHGSHVFKFGGEFIREQNNNTQAGGYRSDYQFRGILNFANDACCFFQQQSVNPTTGGVPNGLRHFRTSDYAFFAQDQWKIRPNLTLNIGLRWEYFTPLEETNDVMTNYVYGSQGLINGTVQPTKQLFNPDRNNFSPKIGFAWSPFRDDTGFVIRGGFALAYNRNFGTVFSNIRQNTPFFAEVSTCCFFDPGAIVGPPPGSNIQYAIGSNNTAFSYPANPNFAFGVAPDGALCGNATCSSITKVDLFGALPNEPNPYVYNFHLDMQKEIGKHDVFTLGYYGSISRKLIRTIDVNRLIPGDTFGPDPNTAPAGGQDKRQTYTANGTLLATPIPTGNNRFNRIFIPLPDVNASYSSLVASLNHRFSRGLQVTANYTWSHSIDTSSFEIGFQQTDPANQLLDKGSSDYDVRHNFSLAAVYEVPFLRNRKDFLGKVVGGWTVSTIISKHSGFPWSPLIGSCDTNNDRNGDGTCPDAPAAYFGGFINDASKQQWINGTFPNPAASFDTTTRGPGIRFRNTLIGPGYTDVDLTLAKSIGLPSAPVLGENARIDFRANAFNAFNILNLASLAPATAPTDIKNTGSFGKAPNGLAGRVVEFQIRLSF
ncbi:MAG TPA: TonB-dependent receptor [Terriglobales bacterium]|nr:TonB-dependent receptor [Terriglobales bacterium]